MISVIVPIYNVEKYLHRCIDSILSQSFRDFELILIDDGSPDTSGHICDAYASLDSRVKVIHQENRGVSAARNAALNIACGEYVTFCDSDDFYSDSWLENLHFAIVKNAADVVVSSYLKFTEAENQCSVYSREYGIYDTETLSDRVNYCFDQIFGRKHGWEIWSRIFRLDIIRQHNIRFCETCENFAEDLIFVLEYALYAKRTVSVDVAGYHYCIRSGSMMHSSRGTIKLNAVNEASIFFFTRYKKVFASHELYRLYPVFHFLIMFNQYFLITGTQSYRYLRQEAKNIRQYLHWHKYTKKIFSCRKDLSFYFGKYNARRILLLSHYCIHGNWKRFTFESALFYKFNKPDNISIK